MAKCLGFRGCVCVCVFRFYPLCHPSLPLFSDTYGMDLGFGPLDWVSLHFLLLRLALILPLNSLCNVGLDVAAAYLETSVSILLALVRMPNFPLNPKTFLVCFFAFNTSKQSKILLNWHRILSSSNYVCTYHDVVYGLRVLGECISRCFHVSCTYPAAAIWLHDDLMQLWMDTHDFFFHVLMILGHVTQCCRIWAWVAQMVCAIWDCTLLMGHAWSSWYLHSWGPYKGWNSQYPIMVHCRRGYILHRFYNTVCRRDYSLCMGRGEEMGWYPQAWLWKHWPNLPQQQPHWHRCWLPSGFMVWPSSLGLSLTWEGQGSEDKGDQEWKVGNAGSFGCSFPGFVHRHTPHWQLVGPPCWPWPQHHFCCESTILSISSDKFLLLYHYVDVRTQYQWLLA